MWHTLQSAHGAYSSNGEVVLFQNLQFCLCLLLLSFPEMPVEQISGDGNWCVSSDIGWGKNSSGHVFCKLSTDENKHTPLTLGCYKFRVCQSANRVILQAHSTLPMNVWKRIFRLCFPKNHINLCVYLLHLYLTFPMLKFKAGYIRFPSGLLFSHRPHPRSA